MGMLNVPDDEPIVAGMVSRSIEGAQKRVEGHNFDIRKHLLDYDDVMNKQRSSIYGLRREALKGENLEDVTREMLSDVVSHFLDLFADERSRHENWNLDGLRVALAQQFNAVVEFPAAKEITAEQISDAVKKSVGSAFENQKTHLGHFYGEVQKMLLLQAIDQRWKEHLLRIDQLREWINLRAYAQKEPLNEYKQEAFRLFTELMAAIKADYLEKLFKIQLVLRDPLADASVPPIDPAAARPAPQPHLESEDDDEAREKLDALKPKKQRMILSSGPIETEPDDDGSGLSRSERRRMERDKKKKRF
jgi:preprotein translocase subunit SecA